MVPNQNGGIIPIGSVSKKYGHLRASPVVEIKIFAF